MPSAQTSRQTSAKNGRSGRGAAQGVRRATTAGRIGGVLAIIIGVLHLFLAPVALHLATWLGALFIIGGVVLLVTAIGLFARSSTPAWMLAGLVTLGMFVGGIASRTIGLFGLHFPWSPILIFALVLEGILLVLWAGTGRPTAAR